MAKPTTPQHIIDRNRKNGRTGGRRKGSKNKATLEKEAIQKGMQQRVLEQADRLLDTQMALARGTTYLFKIEKEVVVSLKNKRRKVYRPKKPELVTNLEEIRNYIAGVIESGNAEDETDSAATYYYITTKDPDKDVIKDMFDRTFGRAAQSMALDVTTDGEKLKVFDENQIRRIASRVVADHKQVKK